MYMGSGEWLTADSLPPIQIEWYIVQPDNMVKRGIGNGDGRYVKTLLKRKLDFNNILFMIVQQLLECIMQINLEEMLNLMLLHRKGVFHGSVR